MAKNGGKKGRKKSEEARQAAALRGLNEGHMLVVMRELSAGFRAMTGAVSEYELARTELGLAAVELLLSLHGFFGEDHREALKDIRIVLSDE